MFGLMNPGRQDTTFRRAYARCCQHQRRAYGLTSLGFLSYESVLLYLFALDAGTLSAEDLPPYTCCRLRPLPSRPPSAEGQVARFCAALGLLLAHIKVSDDVRDGRSLPARLARWLLRRRFRAAFDHFGRLDAGFTQRVEQFIEDHLALEKAGTPIALADYARPTADAFGYVFGLMARLSGLEAQPDLLNRLGQHVGAAIIAFDCAVDWSRDRRRGDFNPLPDGEQSAEAALAYCRERLTQAAQECRAAFGDNSHAAHALLGVRERIAGRCRASVCASVRAGADSRLRRWGVRRKGAFQVNAGWDVWAGAATLVAFALSGLRWLFASQPDGHPDLPPQQAGADVPPGTLPDAPPVAAPTGRRKRGSDSSCCCDVPDCFFCGECDVGGCDALDCSGCDCPSCDCS